MKHQINRALFALAAFMSATALAAAALFGGLSTASAQTGAFDCTGTDILGATLEYSQSADRSGLGPVVLVDTTNPTNITTYLTETELLTAFTALNPLTDPANRFVLNFPNQIAATPGGDRILLTGDVAEVEVDAAGNFVRDASGNLVTVPNSANDTYIIDYSLTGGSNFYVRASRSAGGAVNPVDGLFYFGQIASPAGPNASLRYQTYQPGTGAAPAPQFVYQWPSTPSDSFPPPGGAGDYLFDADGRLTVLASATSDMGDRTFIGYQSTAVGTGPYDEFVKINQGTTSTLDGLAFGSNGELWLSSPTALLSIDPFEGDALIPQINRSGFQDLGDCVGAKLVTLQKSFPVGRVASTDQATLELNQVSTNPVADPRIEQATTTGPAVSIQDEKIGPFLVVAGAKFRIAETAAPGTDLSPYQVSYECSTDGVIVSSGPMTETNGDYSVEVDMPAEPSMVCTIINSLDSGLTLEKSVQSIQSSAAGATVNYQFTVTNSGNAMLSNIVLDDPLLDDESCPQTTLSAGLTMECTGSYVLTQADVDSCVVNNRATVTAANPAGEAVTATSAIATTLAPTAALSVTSVGTANDPNGNGTLDLGEVVDYKITVENTGEETVNGVSVADPKADAIPVCPAGALAPGASTVCTASRTVTEAEVIAGEMVSEATATATGACSNTEVPAVGGSTIAVDQPLGIQIAKDGAAAGGKEFSEIVAGDVVDYTFDVTNTGFATLGTITVVDTVVPEVTCPAETLAPNESIRCTGSYALTQADVDGGDVANVATATGTGPNGETTEGQSEFTFSVGQTPAISIVKTGTPAEGKAFGDLVAGDGVNYTFAVTNTGVVTLTEVVVVDNVVTEVTCPAQTLAPGASMECSAGYVLSQVDIDSAGFVNVATATGVDPNSNQVSATDNFVLTVAQTASISLVKTGVSTDGKDVSELVADDGVEYIFTVTNTGVVTLNSVTVIDTVVPVVTCPGEQLAPGESMECSASHVITQSQVDAGGVINVANVTGVAPGGQEVADDDEFVLAVVPTPAMSVVKEGVPADGKDASELIVGDVVDYSFTVTNTGQLTLSDVSVVDTVVAEVVCPGDSLAPGDSLVCTGTYALTQDDIDSGEVVNVATAKGSDPMGIELGAEDDVVLTIVRDDPLHFAVTKSGEPVDVDGDGFLEAGEFINYTIVVQNIASVTISDLQVEDTKAGRPNCGGVRVLAPDESVSCTVRYLVTQADVDAGEVLNVATATGKTPDGTEVTDWGDDATKIALPPGTIELDKIAPVGVLDVGKTVTYDFVVTNSGQVPLGDVDVVDSMIEAVDCPQTELAPNEKMKCTGKYVVQQADLDSGKIFNTAETSGTSPGGDIVRDEDTVEYPTSFDPQLDFSKRAPLGEFAEGKTLTYEFVVTNTGAVTLHDLAIVDSLVSDVECPATKLAPGEQSTCVGSYVVTAEDIEATSIVNTATATAKDPDDNPIERQDNQRVILYERVVITVQKPVVDPTPLPTTPPEAEPTAEPTAGPTEPAVATATAEPTKPATAEPTKPAAVVPTAVPTKPPVVSTPVPKSPKPPLALTGSTPMTAAALAAGLILVGFFLVAASQSRRF